MKSGENLSQQEVDLAWEAVDTSRQMYDRMVAVHGSDAVQAGPALEAGYGELGVIGNAFDNALRLADAFSKMENSPLAVSSEGHDETNHNKAVSYNKKTQERIEGVILHVIENDGELLDSAEESVTASILDATEVTKWQWHNIKRILDDHGILTFKKDTPTITRFSSISIEPHNIATIEGLIKAGSLSGDLTEALEGIKELVQQKTVEKKERSDVEVTLDDIARVDTPEYRLGFGLKGIHSRSQALGQLSCDSATEETAIEEDPEILEAEPDDELLPPAEIGEVETLDDDIAKTKVLIAA